MGHRVQYLLRFLEKKEIKVKVLDISFRHEPQSLFGFLKNIFLFPSRALTSHNCIIHFPSLPFINDNHDTSSAFAHFMYTLIEFILAKIVSRSLDYNVVIAEDPISAFVASAARKPNSFFVYEDVDYYEDLQSGKTRGKFISLLENAALKRADVVVSVSEPLLRRACLANSDCILVPNGAKLEYFRKPRELCRERSFVYAGSIVEWTGLEVAIEGFLILRKRIPGITMLIVGDGKDKDTLEALVRNLSLQDSISFTGRVPYDQMAELLCKSCVGLATFRPGKAAAFASPLKLFDYMAAGVPIIATDIGDIGRILRESESGFAIRWDVKEFVKAAETLLTNRTLWLDFHEKGLRYVEKYDWDKLFDGWLQEIKNRIE